jgi:hypothetical protein
VPKLFTALSAVLAATVPLAAAAAPAAAQSKVALLPVALYTAGANVQEASDSLARVVADSVLAARLDSLLPGRVASGDAVRRAIASPAAVEAAGGKRCAVIVACAREVGRAVGAAWVVMAKVSKTSNLIWLFTGDLVDVASGTLELDDTTELKGDPVRMTRAGTAIFADRVARAVRGELSSR